MTCKECGGPVPIKSPHAHGRQSSWCSSQCKAAGRKAYYRRWSQANRERLAKARDDNREQVRAWNRDFYHRHRERRKAARVAMYAANSERELRASKHYAATHRDTIRALGRKSRQVRRAKIAGAFVERVDPRVVFERDKGICGICGLPVVRESGWEVDHVIPLSKGGAHSYANVQLAHPRCNRTKGATLPIAS